MADERRNGKLSFDEFRHILAGELELDADRIMPETSFFIDLRVSPAHVVDTMLRLDGKGINIPLELAWLVETVGDAYQVMLYTSRTNTFQINGTREVISGWNSGLADSPHISADSSANPLPIR